MTEKKALFSDNTKENCYHCIKCGLCLAHCPVYKELLTEDATPRGKVQLSRFMAEGTIQLSEEVKTAFFSKCLLCGSCVAFCPSGVHGDHLFSGVRWRAAQRYGIDWRKKMLFQIMANKWMMSTSAWFGKWARKAFGGVEKGIQAGALSVGRIPKMNEVPFSKQVAEVVKPKGKVNARVLYFHGCATNYLYGDIGNAVVDVLSRMGVEVITPKDQGCCGLPIFMSGDRETSVTVIRETLKLFARPDIDAVVVDCGTCGAALKNEYPHLLKELRDLGEGGTTIADAEIQAAELLSGKAKDVTVFISEHMDWLPKMKGNGKKIRVTYHDPCHLVKGQKVSAQPRNVLKAMPGVEYVEMPAADACCGGGGSFQVEFPETSKAITKRKVANIHSTGAQVLCTCCPGCNLTIGAHLDPAKEVRVLHPVQLLSQALQEGGKAH